MPVVPARLTVRKGIWEVLKCLETLQKAEFIDSKQNIIYNDTLVTFSARDLPDGSQYLVSFFPYKQKAAYWTKTQNIKAMTDVIEFCNSIGNDMFISVEQGTLHLIRLNMNETDCIDISDWEVSFPQLDPPEKESLGAVLENTDSTHYKYILDKVPRDKSFSIFTQTYLKDATIINKLTRFLNRFGKTEGPKSLITAREYGEILSTKERDVFVFVDTPRLLEDWYRELKIFFDSQRTPTQYIKDATLKEKLEKLPGVGTNLILEMMTKLGSKPIQLRPPEEIVDTDGFLCLSSIDNAARRLFGALFTYSKEGLEVEEEIQIYPDIDFTTHEDTLEMSQDKVELLSEKIFKLVGREITVDLLLTMEWSRVSLRKLVENLKRWGIQTRRAYYVSSKTSRYVDSWLIGGSLERCASPYLMINKTIAFLRTCTDVRMFAHLSSLFIQLMWPQDGKLELADLKKILWLVKKRMYRIQEFPVLKIPEPIHIFRNVRTMFLGEIREKLTIPLRLLI